MANGYQPPDDEPETPQDVPDEPEAPSNGEAKPAKLTQAQANYRESDKRRCCGLCPHWHDCEKNWGSCEVVEGEISCFGLCDQYVRGDNPFREGESGEFTGGRPVAVVAPAPSLAAMGGLTPAIGGPNPPVVSMTQGPPQTSNPRIAQTGAMQGPAINGGRLRIGGKIYGG